MLVYARLIFISVVVLLLLFLHCYCITLKQFGILKPQEIWCSFFPNTLISHSTNTAAAYGCVKLQNREPRNHQVVLMWLIRVYAVTSIQTPLNFIHLIVLQV